MKNPSRLLVHNIQVKGCVHSDPNQIRAASGVSSGAMLLSIDKAAVVERLQQLPWVAQARIKVQPPNKVTLEIAERRPSALLMGDRLWVLDTLGHVIEPLSLERPLTLPVISGVDVGLHRGEKLATHEAEVETACSNRPKRVSPKDTTTAGANPQHRQAMYAWRVGCKRAKRELRELRQRSADERAKVARAMRLLDHWSQTPIHHRFPIGQVHVHAALGFVLYRGVDGAEVSLGWDDGEHLPRRIHQLDRLLTQLHRGGQRLRYARLDNRKDTQRVVYGAAPLAEPSPATQVKPAGPSGPRPPVSQHNRAQLSRKNRTPTGRRSALGR